MKIKNNKKGFTLIELSIVLIIIGLLVAGIVAGSNLIDSAKLTKAQSLTKNSPVGGIKNLTLWLEATLEDGYVDSMAEGVGVTKWKSYNMQLAGINVDNVGPVGVGPLAPPIYSTDTQSGLPMLDFTGISSMEISPRGPVLRAPVTTFVVIEFNDISKSGTIYTSYIGSEELAHYVGSSTLIMHHMYNGSLAAAAALPMTPTFSSKETLIIRATSKGEGSKPTLSINGGSTSGVDYVVAGSAITNVNNSSGVSGSKPSTIGVFHDYSTRLDGKIGELIAYHRDLSESEIDEVESYLAKKWDVNLRP